MQDSHRKLVLLSVLLLAIACSGGNDDASPTDGGAHSDGGVCQPKSCQALGKTCGSVSNGCGKTIQCGTCPAPSSCGSNNTCSCKPTTCAAEGKNCGTTPDGCGGTLECGSCASGQTCGAGGPNVCGSGTCTPTTCEAQAKNCGVISDNCASTLDCGTCAAPGVCGGNGVENVCGCTPTTCEAQAKNCGKIEDGCGSTLDCGGCAAGESCSASNQCVGAAGDGGPPPTGILPADRATTWNPGLLSAGGIPNRTTVCATLQASTTDATAKIQAALDACPDGQVVQLAAGTFLINSDIIYVKKAVTLRGAGAGKTFLKRTNGAVDKVDDVGVAKPVIIVGESRWTYGESSTALKADGAKGTTSVSVASSAGLSAGMLVLIDELSGAGWRPDPQGHGRQVWASADWRTVWQRHNPTVDFIDDPFPDAAGWFCRQDRPTSEIHEIASVSGSTVTFTTPLHIDYRLSHSAELTHLGYAAVRNAGIEAMTVTGGDDGDIRFVNAAQSWAKSIEVATWRGEGFALEFTHRVEIRDSYVHDAAISTPGGGAYAISIQGGTSEALIENNIVLRANKVIVARSSGAGSVVGYNYMDQGFIDYAPAWQEMGVGGSHMVGPHHMLFEGNLSFNGDNDHTHGSSIYHTYFRNHLTGFRASFKTNTGISIDDLNNVPGPTNGPRRCAGASAFSYWMSFVGNVLGLPGKMNGWTYEKNDADDAIWAIGWENHEDLFDPDPNVAKNLLRNGNYDFLTNSVHWHGIGNAGATSVPLPNSLYLTAKPAFFGAKAWPWVEPTTGTTYTLPAKARYDAGTPFAQP